MKKKTCSGFRRHDGRWGCGCTHPGLVLIKVHARPVQQQIGLFLRPVIGIVRPALAVYSHLAGLQRVKVLQTRVTAWKVSWLLA